MSFDRADTEKKVIAIIAKKLAMQPEQINADSTFKSLGADSLDIVEIIMNFEEIFKIEIKDDDAEKIIDVARAVDYVHALRTE